MSPVSVGELTTVVEPAAQPPAAEPAAPAPPWEDEMRVRRAAIEIERERSRLRAEGLDA